MDRLNETTYNKEVKSNPSDRIVVEIGDSLQPDFKPQVKIKRWDNEVNFSMRAEEHPEAIVEEVDGVIKYITPKYEVHQYEKPEAGEDGGFEFEWVLKEIPESNVLTTTIQSKGLDFFYQPALTQEEIDSGSSRPENVIGSYAVYHSEKRDNKVGGMEYKTGKAFHIYRPEAVDANGVRTWCELNIDNGNLTVTVPQGFLDTAVYPVIVDPTFGYTSLGVSDFGLGFDNTNKASRTGNNNLAGVDGTLNSIHLPSKCLASDTVTIMALLSLTDGGGSGIHTGVASVERTDISNTTSYNWFTFTAASEALSNANTYLLSATSDGATVSASGIISYIPYDSSTEDQPVTSQLNNGYATLSVDPWTPSNNTGAANRLYSIYATYTASSSFTPTPMIHMMAQSGGLV